MKIHYFSRALMILISALTIILSHGNSFADTIDKAIEHYQNADFEAAENIFEKIAGQEDSIKNRQTALVYLALLQMSAHNPTEADHYLFKLLLLDPSFELKTIEDISSEIENHFNKIKSGDIFKAILFYQDGEFEKAKKIFEGLAASENKAEDCQIALVYLAILETASLNLTGADAYLSKLLSLNPSFELRLIEDANQEVKERFEQIKSGKKPKAKATPVQPEKDTVPPSGEITGIKDSYRIGNTVSYEISGKDNQRLKHIVFKVKENSSATKTYDADNKSVTYKSSFSAEGWKAGTYNYSLLITDETDNSKEYTGSFVLTEKEPVKDTVKPTGEITGIKNSYKQGDTVKYTVRAGDNKSLKKMTFRVKDNASVTKIWSADGTSASYESYFSTGSWGPGTYFYSLLIEDDSDNFEEMTGDFAVTLPPEKIEELKTLIKEGSDNPEESKEKPDTEKPKGEIVGIADSYTHGDTVNYTVSAKDNKSLKKMTFEVKEKSSAAKTWKASGLSDSQNSSFSTARWSPGTYHYSLSIEDNAGNSQEYSGSFVLKAKAEASDTSKPAGEILGIRQTYTQGDTVSYTARAKDNNSLKKLIFKVNRKKSAGKIWNAGGTSASYNSSFSTDGWEPGTYNYSLSIEDASDNSQEYAGSFTLRAREPDRDNIKPTGKISGIKGSYTEGEKVNYTVDAADNKSLKIMTFSVKENPSVTKIWVTANNSATYSSSFPTQGWRPGTYHYVLMIEDGAGNSQEYTGSFALKEREPDRDNIKPTGEISGINNRYTEGDTVHYTARARDNNRLKQMIFEADKIKEKWDISGTSASQMSFFSTRGWRTGNYDYSLRVYDSEGNTERYKGSFVLAARNARPEHSEASRSSDEPQPKADTTKPSATFDRTKGTYEQGETVTFVIHANDNESLKSISLSVENSSVRQSWDVNGTSARQEYSFSTKDWKPGTYNYSIRIKDKADNFQDYAGRFLITKTEASFDKLRRLNQELSQAYVEYRNIKMQEEQGVNVDRQLAPVIRKIIGILKSLETAYKEFPSTREIQQGVRDTQNAIKKKQEELNSIR